MKITRRDFMRYVSLSAVALGLSRVQLDRLGRVLASPSKPPVLWLHGASCTGCSVSLLNAVNPTVDQLLVQSISLRYHPTLMAASGDAAVAAARSTADQEPFILVVEGAIPTAYDGRCCIVWDEGGREVSMAEAVETLAQRARYVVAVGTCASFGGIPARSDLAGAQSLGQFLGRGTINIPGCPAHPDWIIGTLARLLSCEVPALDNLNRPVAYYTPQVIHERCPRRGTGEAHRFGENGRCLEELGCRGPRSHADCDTRRWNNGRNWCIGVNGLCVGCTEPAFPAFPLHREEEEDDAPALQAIQGIEPYAAEACAWGAQAEPTATASPVPSATPTVQPSQTPEPSKTPEQRERVWLPLGVRDLTR